MSKMKKQNTEEKDDFGLVRIPIDDLELWELNPNEEDPDKFNLLAQEIVEDNERIEDMDQPLIVVRHPNKPGKYIVFAGNHRLMVMKLKGATSAISKIKDWDEKTAMEKAVKRNLVQGRLNEAKFTRLVNEYTKRNAVDVSMAPNRFGFLKQAEFYKHYRSAKDKAMNESARKAKEEAKEEVQRVKNLQFLVNKLFREYGDTLEQNFMFFLYGEKLHLMLEMDQEAAKSVKQLTDYCFENKVNVNDVMKRVLAPGMSDLENIVAMMKGEADVRSESEKVQ